MWNLDQAGMFVPLLLVAAFCTACSEESENGSAGHHQSASTSDAREQIYAYCHVPESIYNNRERPLTMIIWSYETLTDPAARALLQRLEEARDVERPDILDEVAAAHGIDECPLSDWWRERLDRHAPAEQEGQ